MIEAKVKDSGRWRSITACSGLEFIKGEYRIVPAGFEEEAKANSFLETRNVKKPAAKKAPAKKPVAKKAPVEKPVAEKEPVEKPVVSKEA